MGDVSGNNMWIPEGMTPPDMEDCPLLDDILFCDNDEENEAVCYCEDCDQNLCKQCDDVFHRSAKRQEHKRVPITNASVEELEKQVATQEALKNNVDEESESEGEELSEEPQECSPKVFGIAVEDVKLEEQQQVPFVLPMLIRNLISTGGLDAEGIFRVSAEKGEIDILTKQINEGMVELPQSERRDPHVAACLIKNWFRQFPDSIIPMDKYSKALECVRSNNHSQMAVAVLGFWTELKSVRQKVLAHLSVLVQEIVKPIHAATNKMTLKNLSIVFAPTLLRSPSDKPEEAFQNIKLEIEFVLVLFSVLPTQHLRRVYFPEPPAANRRLSLILGQTLSEEEHQSENNSKNPVGGSLLLTDNPNSTSDCSDNFLDNYLESLSAPTQPYVPSAVDSHPTESREARSTSTFSNLPQSVSSSSSSSSSSSFKEAVAAKQPLREISPQASLKESRHVFKILVVGNASCGKTSVIRRYVKDDFDPTYISTIGADFQTKTIPWDNGSVVHLQLWDIAGQDRYARMTRPYYQGAHGALVICDVVRSASLEAVKAWKSDIDLNLPELPVVLIANKCDRLKDGTEGMLIGGKLQEYTQTMKFVGWFISSAMKNMNINEAMVALVKAILAKKSTSRDSKLVSLSAAVASTAFNTSTKQQKGNSSKIPMDRSDFENITPDCENEINGKHNNANKKGSVSKNVPQQIKLTAASTSEKGAKPSDKGEGCVVC